MRVFGTIAGSLRCSWHFINFNNIHLYGISKQICLIVSTILLDDSPSAQAVAQGFAPWPRPTNTLDDLTRMAQDAGFAVEAIHDLGPLCLPGFDWMCPPPPPKLTDHPVIELRRLFETGRASYPMLICQPGGKTQK